MRLEEFFHHRCAVLVADRRRRVLEIVSQKGFISLADLAREPFVLLSDTHCLGEQVVSFCRQKEFRPPVRCATAQLLTVQELVALGHGVSLVPRAAGTFESRLTVDVPADVESLMPGMTGTVKLTTYRNERALLVPSTAVFRDEGSSSSHVYLISEGKPVKTEITIGKASGGKTEVLNGLKVGDELLANKP